MFYRLKSFNRALLFSCITLLQLIDSSQVLAGHPIIDLIRNTSLQKEERLQELRKVLQTQEFSGQRIFWNKKYYGIDDLEKSFFCCNKVQETPLTAALKESDREVIELVLQSGADPSVSNSVEELPLVIAFDSGSLELMDLVLQGVQSGQKARLLQDLIRERRKAFLAYYQKGNLKVDDWLTKHEYYFEVDPADVFNGLVSKLHHSHWADRLFIYHSDGTLKGFRNKELQQHFELLRRTIGRASAPFKNREISEMDRSLFDLATWGGDTVSVSYFFQAVLRDVRLRRESLGIAAPPLFFYSQKAEESHTVKANRILDLKIDSFGAGSQLYLVEDLNGNPIAMRYVKDSEMWVYDLAQLKEGVILEGNRKTQLIRIYVNSYEEPSKFKFQMNYLENQVNGEFAGYTFDLVHMGREWALNSSEAGKIYRISFFSKIQRDQVVGITLDSLN